MQVDLVRKVQSDRMGNEDHLGSQDQEDLKVRKVN